jgi:hypothetical protein
LTNWPTAPVIDFDECASEKEKQVWKCMHNDFLAHQSAEHCIILRQFRGHFLKATGKNHDGWVAALYSAMSGMKYSEHTVHDALKMKKNMEGGRYVSLRQK